MNNFINWLNYFDFSLHYEIFCWFILFVSCYPKTLTKKEYKTKQILELLKEISSPYDQIEIITNLLKEIRIKDQKRFISDRYLDIFESELDEVIEILEDDIIYFDPTP